MERSVQGVIDRVIRDYAQRKNLTNQEAKVLADRLLKIWEAAVEKKETHRDDLFFEATSDRERLAFLRQHVTGVVLQSMHAAHSIGERSLDCPLLPIMVPDLAGSDQQLNLEGLKQEDNELLLQSKELAVRVSELTTLCAFREQQQKTEEDRKRCRPVDCVRPLCKQVAAEPQ